jgi:putative pyoverdin transport system ATP-binding/permease protein
MNLIKLFPKASWLRVMIAIGAGFVSGGCSAQLIALINTVLASGNYKSQTLNFILLSTTGVITTIVSQFLLVSISQDAVYKLRLKLSQAILAAPLQRLEQIGVGSLLAVLTVDILSLSSIVYIFPFLCIDLAIVLGCLIYLTSLSGIIFLIAIASLAVSIFIIQMLTIRGQKIFNSVRDEEDRLFKGLRELVDGVKELKISRVKREDFMMQGIEDSANVYRKLSIRAMRIFSIVSGIGQLAFFFIIGILLFIVPTLMATTPSVLSSFILTVAYIIIPLGSIIEKFPQLFQANASFAKIEQIGLQLADKVELDHLSLPLVSEDKIKVTLTDVFHTYSGEEPDSRFTIGPINLSFSTRELIFIVGGNGSGKSTLAKIITGLYVADKGNICLDGKSITEDNLDWYRQHFAIIFSDFYLFDRLLGIDVEGTKREAQAYLKILQLDQKVKIKNDGLLSTINLSQGQRKRLALLISYLEDRQIYLFDEWAAEQDPVFRDLFYNELLPNLRNKGKLVIVITHDDRYFHLADRIIKLDYGKIESDLSNLHPTLTAGHI